MEFQKVLIAQKSTIQKKEQILTQKKHTKKKNKNFESNSAELTELYFLSKIFYVELYLKGVIAHCMFSVVLYDTTHAGW